MVTRMKKQWMWMCLFLMAAVLFLPCRAEAAILGVTLPAPTGVAQIGATSTEAGISWNAVEQATEYIVEYSENVSVGWKVAGSTSGLNGTISGLKSGTSYYVRITSVYTSMLGMDTLGETSTPVEFVTAPEAVKVQSVSVTRAEETSLGIQWGASTGAVSYKIYDGSNRLIGSSDTTSFTWNGLKAGESYDLYIQPVRTSAAGYEAGGTLLKCTGLKTRPLPLAAPARSQFGYDSSSNISTSVRFVVNGTASGYQVAVYNMKTGKQVFATEADTASFIPVSNTPYRWRARYYTLFKGEKIYGAWSEYRCFCNMKITAKWKGKHKIQMSWKKIPKAKSFTVSISKKKNKGYKKVRTLKGSARKITISRYGKKKLKRGNRYYVRMTFRLKDGNKSVTSDNVETIIMSR